MLEPYKGARLRPLLLQPTRHPGVIAPFDSLPPQVRRNLMRGQPRFSVWVAFPFTLHSICLASGRGRNFRPIREDSQDVEKILADRGKFSRIRCSRSTFTRARVLLSVPALCLAQFDLRHDALMRLDQAFDPIPTPTLLFWQHRSYLVCADCGIAR
jgi:hypothetical protein